MEDDLLFEASGRRKEIHKGRAFFFVCVLGKNKLQVDGEKKKVTL